IRIIRDEARITRLGQGLHEAPYFLPESQERTLKVLREYKKYCDKAGVQKIMAVGTASFRKAKNAPEFVQKVKDEIGIEIRIISGDEEARLSFLSVEKDFGSQYPNLYALDIGGGSTEIISKEGGVSLDLGGVVLTERIVKHDPLTRKELRMLEEAIDGKLKDVGAGPRACPADGHPQGGAPTLIALAGSVTTLSAIKQKLSTWDGTKVQGSILTLQDLEEMIALFRRTTNEERRAIVGMVKGREDTILTGTLILKKVMEKLGVTKVIVSDRGLRFGLLYTPQSP
ncbi:MAG: Ppx/GppA family phosphatase, partial [Deltaproteobacteria bacterium]|nr:Ppx/GppA family phosphatase [Deltaproteobacteria bacterium]